MPCGTFSANAVFFSIGVLTYNLYLVFRSAALGNGWERSQVQTVRWRLFQTAGKIGRHGRRLYLKISAAMLDTFSAIRERTPQSCRKEPFQKPRDRLAHPFSRSVTSEKPLTGKSRKKRLAKAKDDGENRYRAARRRAGAHRVTQTGLKTAINPARPRRPEAHRGFWG